MTKPAPLIVRTETWNTRTGPVVKAAVRKTNGTFVGATNQTAPVHLTIVGRK